MNRALSRFAIATWAAAASLVAIFALFWRIAYAPPHALWAIVTTGAVALMGALTVIVGIYQFVRGPQRMLAAAIVLLGTTPLVWLAMLLLSFNLQARDRAVSMRLDTTTRIVAFWVESVCDVEARWRYPRWTYGKYEILLDDGQTPEAEKLVAQMDEHVQQMSAVLHSKVPHGLARWVRGSLLGFHGNAIISWAICDADQNSRELKSLDRHEMAHVLITALGSVDQDPPMLLCEGWAETQSKERSEMILTLDQKSQTGPIYSLQELVSPDWYGRSDGPAYDHGGPLCIYLMEHYGVEKFRTLYHGVRFASFAIDSERILGDKWNVVEDNFWKWLNSEAAKIKTERGIKPTVLEPEKDVTFAKSVDPRDWQTIIDGYRNTWAKRPPMPGAFAYVTEHEWINPPENPGGAQVKHCLSSKYVVDGDSVWRLRDYGPDRYFIGEVFTPELSSYAVVSTVGHVDSYRPSNKQAVSDAAEDGARWSDTCDLAHYLPIDPKRYYGINAHIEAIRRPVARDGAEWEIEYVSRTRDKGDETRCKLGIDAAADWSVVSDEQSSPDEHTESHYTLGNVFGRLAPTGIIEHTTKKSGTSTFQLHFRELSLAEAQEARQEAEKIARRRPETNWYAALIRPRTLAIAWPATGALLLAGGIVLQRRSRIAAEHLLE